MAVPLALDRVVQEMLPNFYEMNSENLLIIFVKKPLLGKVKTRLAKTIGNEKALHIYQFLLRYTQSICSNVNADRAIFYSDFIDNNDSWFGNKFSQIGDSLGDKMANAFEEVFKVGYQKVVIIGSDCYELSTEIINQAFDCLANTDTVIGPAKDGGYYLLGMKDFNKTLFQNKSWSTNEVLNETINDINALNLRCHLLVTLSDIDEEKDLPLELKNL